MQESKLLRVGDSTIVVEFSQRIDPSIHARVSALAAMIRRTVPEGVRDIIESYCAVTVEFDPLRTDIDHVIKLLQSKVNKNGAFQAGREITLPVCYGGEHGPDLECVARFAKCSETEVIEAHLSRDYLVYMLGFRPGFAYMGSVDSRIAIPRRATPRLKVPIGSVGLAGYQTGVYPSTGPGGWQLIGRSSARLFVPESKEPFLLRGGDVIRFESITHQEFNRSVGV